MLNLIVTGGRAALVPLCCLCAWGLVGLLIWNFMSMLIEGIQTAQKLHQIPCADCQFFTGEHHLKCTVHPYAAFSEQAIDCRDFAKG